MSLFIFKHIHRYFTALLNTILKELWAKGNYDILFKV